MKTFASKSLDKGVVLANDVPGFISNRIGTYYFATVIRTAQQLNLSVDEVDAITGPAMGRPASATYRTLDMVGLDIFVDICDNTREALEGTESGKIEGELFQAPALTKDLIQRGWLGNKSGQGFYKRITNDGESTIFSLDTVSMEYQPRQRAPVPELKELMDIEDVGERIRSLVSSGGKTEELTWKVLSELMAYSAWKLDEVANDVISIDRAMRWGFNWALGPFETWDALGVADTVHSMSQDGVALPDWVKQLAYRGNSFYKTVDGVSLQVDSSLQYTEVDA